MNAHKRNADELLGRPLYYPTQGAAVDQIQATRAVGEALLYIGDVLEDLVRNQTLDAILSVVNGTAFASMSPNEQKEIIGMVNEKLAEMDEAE